MNTPLLSVQSLSKYYPIVSKGFLNRSKKNQKTSVRALEGVSFEIQRGEIFGVVGESGCGKSTLGRCILRLVTITDGKVIFDGKDISHLDFKQMAIYRSRMQMIFQNPYSSFNPKQSIGKAFREVGDFYGKKREDTEVRIQALMESIKLPAEMLGRHPNEFSGGQLQRLAIARSLITKPDFIVADEPVSALDVSVQAQILNLILNLKEQFSLTMMFISHDLTVIEHVCDRSAVIYLGVLVEIGPTKQLFKNTLHPYTKALISSRPREYPGQATNRILLQGDVPNAIDVPSGCRFSTRCQNAVAGLCDCKSPVLHEAEHGHFVACHLA